MAKVFISIPMLDKPEFNMIYSLYQTIFNCKEHQVRLYFNENDSLISRARNNHITAFLEDYNECDYFMSIDSDIEIVNTFKTNNLITKLIAQDKDFVGGLYSAKQVDNPKCSSVTADGVSAIDFDSGLREMKWLSSGCWCVKRSVVEQMANAYPELVYDGDDNMAKRKVYGLYIPVIREFKDGDNSFKKYLSEDWAFCDRWAKLGGKIYADTSIVLKHYGKQAFSLWQVEAHTRRKNAGDGTTEEQYPESVPPIGLTTPSLPPAGWELT